MSGSTSQLEESGVWCADEDSGDDCQVTSRTAPPLSPKGVISTKNKHSGGSVDASGDVEIVDLKEFDSSKKLKKRSNSSKMVQKNSKRKIIPKGRELEYLRRIQAMSRKRRSSSFSKVFSYRKTAPAAVNRPSSFGIKRSNKPKTVEVDDDDVLWPDPGMFKREHTNRKKNSQQESRRRTRSTATYEFTMKSGCTMMTDTASRNGGSACKKESPTNTATITRSMASRPSVGSTLLRESHFYSDSTRGRNNDTDSLFLDAKESSFDCEGQNTLQSKRSMNKDDIGLMVESLNMRNFLDRKLKSSASHVGLSWLIKQLTCLYVTTVIFILISVLILGLTIWLIQDNNSLRLDLHELKVLVNLYSSGREVSIDTARSDFSQEERNSSFASAASGLETESNML